MSSAVSIPTTNPLVRASYSLLIAALVIGTVTSVFSPRAALLAAAVIFGWSQIGGL
jgi:hypothetical protein